MASPWQQWMPFHIDRFRGSLHVQGMPAAAKIGYLYLLAAQWQSEDCSLPNDDFELQILSGLTQEEWTRLGVLILRRFHTREDERLANVALTTEWTETKRRWDEKQMTPEQREQLRKERSEAGKAGATRRWAGHKPKRDKPKQASAMANDGKLPSSDGKPMANAMANDGFNRTEPKPNNKDLKPSRVSAASDPRHVLFRHVCKDYAAFKEVSFVWDGSEAKALDLLLKAAPDLTVDAFKRCIWHRAKSAGVTHGDRPRLWLPNITKYQQGPLNEFGKTGDAHGTGKTGKSIDAAQQAIAILAERRRDRAVAGEAGSTAAGEAGHRGLLGAGGGPDEVRPAGH